MKKILNTLLLWFVMAVGIAMMIGAYTLYNTPKHPIDNAVLTEGIITQITHHQRTDSYTPTVRFTGPDGDAIDFISPAPAAPAQYKVGESVMIFYAADTPQKALIRRPSLYGGELWLFTMGAVFFLLCFLPIVFIKRFLPQ